MGRMIQRNSRRVKPGPKHRGHFMPIILKPDWSLKSLGEIKKKKEKENQCQVLLQTDVFLIIYALG